MAISATNLTAAGDGVNRSEYTTASISPGSNRLILAAVTTQGNLDTANPTLSGNGLTWVEIVSLIYSSNHRLTVFRAMGASPTAGAVTITRASAIGCSWVIDEFDGVDTGGTNGSAAVVQSNTNTATGNTGTAVAVTLSAFGSADNRPYAAFVSTRGSGTELTEEHTELATAFHTSPQNTVMTQWRSDGTDTSITATPSGIATVDVAGIALEIKAASAGGITGPLIGFRRLGTGGILLGGRLH